MSTTSTKEAIDVQLIPTAKIAAVPGFNPRGEFSRDDEEFKSLRASIAERGIESPIKVGAPDADGIHPIIFGHRRHAAAEEEKLDLVPSIVDPALDEKQRFLAAIAENRARSEMSPLAEARALQVLRDEFGLKQSEAADAMAMSERSARNRQAMLDLPDDVQKLLDAGELPLEAAIHLAPIARVSPKAVELMIASAAKATSYNTQLADLVDKTQVGQLLEQVAAKANLQQIHDRQHQDTTPQSLGIDQGYRKELKKLYDEIPVPRYYGGRPGFHFGDADAKAAKGGGHLFEFTFERRGSKRTARFITNSEFTFELAKTKVPAMIKEAEKRVKDAGRGVQSTEDQQKARDREEKKREREEAMFAKANAELGAKLGDLDNPKATDVDVVRLVCAMALGHDEIADERISDGLGKINPDLYGYSDNDSELDEERFPSTPILEELAGAKTAGECLAVVLRVGLAARHVSSGRHYAPWGLGPTEGPVDVHAMLDDLGERLKVLPKAAQKEVKKHQAERRKRAEREAKEAEERKKAREADQGELEKVYELIKGLPGIPSTDVAKKLKMKANRAYRLLGDLEKAGRIKKASGKYSVVDET